MRKLPMKPRPTPDLPPTLTLTKPFMVGPFEIRESDQSGRIEIFHLDGEGGEFDRGEFARCLHHTIGTFYAKNF